MNAVVIDRQNIFDVAIIASGAAEAAFGIALDNQLSPSSTLVTGAVMAINTTANAGIVKHFSYKKNKPATSQVTRKIVFDITFDRTFEIDPQTSTL